MKGALSADWSQSEDLLGIVLANDAPLSRFGYLLPPSDSLIWVAPDGREEARARLQGSILRSHVRMDGNTLLLVRDRDQFKLVNNLDGTDRIQRLASSRIPADIPSYASLILPMGERHLVSLSSNTVWIVDERVREIHVPRAESRERPYIVGDVVFPSEAKARSFIEKSFPFDGQKNSRAGPLHEGQYLLPFYPDYLDEHTSLYYARHKTDTDSIEVWVRDRHTKSWKMMTRDMPVHSDRGSSVPLSTLEWRYSRPHVGLLLYPVKMNDDDVQWYIHDDRRGKSIPVGGPGSDRMSSMIYEDNRGQFLISIYESRDRVKSDKQRFVYSVATGKLIQLSPEAIKSFDRIIGVSREGSVILGASGDSIFSLRSGEAPLRLWPQDGVRP
jgi:hypothetical protein